MKAIRVSGISMLLLPPCFCFLLLLRQVESTQVRRQQQQVTETDLPPTSNECPLPPSGTANRFYDGFAADCSNENPEILAVESAVFRFLTGQADRVRRVNFTSCYLEEREGGRPYLYDNFAISSLALLDLIQQLQILPRPCHVLHQDLRDLLLSQMSVPLEEITVEHITTYTPVPPPPIEWWEDHFLPTAAQAFSCEFTARDAIEDPRQLPADIRDAFVQGDQTIQQVWRLVKGYLRSPQKQRELLKVQADFDVSLYVPFLKVPLARTYMGLEGELGPQMRAGFPTYEGPSIWYILHTMAARGVEMERHCQLDLTKIISTFQTFLTYLVTTHPCPYCREHFLSRASRNDQHWKDFGLTHTLEPSQSESNLYPLEYLFVGKDGSFRSKLDSITDGNSWMLFVWKLHNTITSVTYYSVQCRTGELFDDLPYKCVEQGCPTERFDGISRITGTSSMGRAWPTSKRYDFWLDSWEEIRSDPAIQEAYATLRVLDESYDWWDRRQYYWTAGNKTYRVDDQEVREAVAALDAAVLATDVLSKEYSLSKSPLHCKRARNSLAQWEPLSVPLPLMEDGNFRPPPPTCIEHVAARRLQSDASSGGGVHCGKGS